MVVNLRLIVVMEYLPHHLYIFNKYNVGQLFHHYLVSTTKEVVSENTNKHKAYDVRYTTTQCIIIKTNSPSRYKPPLLLF